MGNFFKEFTKNVHKHDDLWDVLWVGQQFYQLLGLSPLRYRGQGRIPVPKRVPWGAIISSVVFLGFFVVHSVSDLATINSSSYILSNGFRWFQQLVSVFTSLVAAINAIYCKKIARLVFSLYDFDLKVLLKISRRINVEGCLPISVSAFSNWISNGSKVSKSLDKFCSVAYFVISCNIVSVNCLSNHKNIAWILS